MQDCILEQISWTDTPGFFITAEFAREGQQMPAGIVDFIMEKLMAIRQGVEARKFVYQAEGWRIVLTFFPTDRVVDERYALKNKLSKH